MVLIVLKCRTFFIVSVLRHVSVNCCINVSSVFVSLCQLICRRISFLILMLNVKCINCACMCTYVEGEVVKLMCFTSLKYMNIKLGVSKTFLLPGSNNDHKL